MALLQTLVTLTLAATPAAPYPFNATRAEIIRLFPKAVQTTGKGDRGRQLALKGKLIGHNTTTYFMFRGAKDQLDRVVTVVDQKYGSQEACTVDYRAFRELLGSRYGKWSEFDIPPSKEGGEGLVYALAAQWSHDWGSAYVGCISHQDNYTLELRYASPNAALEDARQEKKEPARDVVPY